MILILMNPQNEFWVFWATHAPTEEDLRFLPVGWSVTYFDRDELPNSLQLPAPQAEVATTTVTQRIMEESVCFFLQVGTGMARDGKLRAAAAATLAAGSMSYGITGRFWLPVSMASGIVINTISLAYDIGAAAMAVREEVTNGALDLHFANQMADNMGTAIDVIEYTEATGNVPDPGAGLAVWQAAQENKWWILGGAAVAVTGYLVWRWYRLGRTEKNT